MDIISNLYYTKYICPSCNNTFLFSQNTIVAMLTNDISFPRIIKNKDSYILYYLNLKINLSIENIPDFSKKIHQNLIFS